jgi:putative transposase
MPRQSRPFLPGIPLHVIQRGNNRQPSFHVDRDYIVYLDKLREYSQKYQVKIHSFVLMTNHVHLLLTPGTAEGPSQLMQALGRYYVRYMNSTYDRTGTLWEGRFKAALINSAEHLLTVSRYIEMNPVRARMVFHPADYPWSSYRGNAMGKTIKLLHPHPVYLALAASEPARKAAYRALFNDRLPDLAIEQIRTATKKGWVLGDSRFKERLEQELGYELPPFPRGGDRRSAKFKVGDKIKPL